MQNEEEEESKSFVGDGIEIRAESGTLIEAAGEKAVDSVR